MSNLQDSPGPQGSGNDTDVPNLPGQCVEHLNPEAQEQILPKPSNQSRSQQHRDAKKKTVDRRWPFITRLFHGASVPHQDQDCTSPSVTKSGKLFGNDLTEICEDGNLPTAILDVLSLIHVKGPSTEGIFRISANISACQALKDKLDSGTRVNLNKECVHVVASVLKEFLQNIPGSVLTSRLYDMWLGVLDQGNEKKKLAAMQSLLEELPYPNVMLLRHLFRMLNNIERNSAVNQMTAYCLSVCMTPSILCLPRSCNSGLANVISNEISLVKFLIENSQKIFGEDMLLYRLAGNSVPMSAAAPLQNEGTIDSEKSVKGSFIKPMITRDSTTSHDNVFMTPSPSAPNKGQLFGKSLNSVCKDSSLPAPILDMLSVIDEKGPDTERIFRTFVNRSYLTLKEEFDSGEKMNLRDESVYVVASVLKEFIRNIQGSLLCSNLYEKWLDVPDQESHDQKISAIQRVLQIAIVEILIENFLDIFGEDATVFYGEIPKSCRDIEKPLGPLNNVAESNKTSNATGDNRGGCHSEKMYSQQDNEESLCAASPYKEYFTETRAGRR